MDDLYRDYILDHYKRPRNFGELDPHDMEGLEHNPLCGDELGVHIRVRDGKIEDLRVGNGAAARAREILVGVRSLADHLAYVVGQIEIVEPDVPGFVDQLSGRLGEDGVGVVRDWRSFTRLSNCCANVSLPDARRLFACS